jgi:hypothetical protein
MKSKSLVSAAIAIAFGAFSLSAAASTRSSSFMGETAPVSAASRTIVIGADTQHVDVFPNETVKFESNGRAFAASFAGLRSGYDLRTLAPEGALDHAVRLYVMLDPLNISGS